MAAFAKKTALALLTIGLFSTSARSRPHTAEAAPKRTPPPTSAPPISILSQRALALRGEGSDARLAALKGSVRGKPVDGWEGWVAQLTCQDTRCDVSLYGEDPYAPIVLEPPTPVLDALLGPGVGIERYPYLTVLGVSMATAKTLRIGQRLRIAATLVDIGYTSGLDVTLADAQLTPAPPLTSVEVAGDGGPAAEVDMQITLSRGPCYGSCPIYELTIDGDGTVTFRGDRFVAPEGTGQHSARITPADRKALLDAFSQADFFALRERYQRPMISDQPSVTLTFRRGVLRKTVYHSFGDLTAPVKLLLLEDQIDELAGTRRWLPKR